MLDHFHIISIRPRYVPDLNCIQEQILLWWKAKEGRVVSWKALPQGVFNSIGVRALHHLYNPHFNQGLSPPVEDKILPLVPKVVTVHDPVGDAFGLYVTNTLSTKKYTHIKNR